MVSELKNLVTIFLDRDGPRGHRGHGHPGPTAIKVTAALSSSSFVVTPDWSSFLPDGFSEISSNLAVDGAFLLMGYFAQTIGFEQGMSSKTTEQFLPKRRSSWTATATRVTTATKLSHRYKYILDRGGLRGYDGKLGHLSPVHPGSRRPRSHRGNHFCEFFSCCNQGGTLIQDMRNLSGSSWWRNSELGALSHSE